MGIFVLLMISFVSERFLNVPNKNIAAKKNKIIIQRHCLSVMIYLHSLLRIFRRKFLKLYFFPSVWTLSLSSMAATSLSAAIAAFDSVTKRLSRPTFFRTLIFFFVRSKNRITAIFCHLFSLIIFFKKLPSQSPNFLRAL